MKTKENLIGQKFSKWTVIGDAPSLQTNGRKRVQWLCRCDCGTERIIRYDHLTKSAKDCGCTQQKSLDLTGKKFSKLTVVGFSHIKHSNTRKKKFWKCKCECSTEKTVEDGALKSGYAKSCGCSRYDWNTLPYGEAAMHAVHRNYTRTADERGLAFDLTMEQFQTLTSSDCRYCGCTPNQKIDKHGVYNGDYIYNGIDRVDNTKGYSMENCVPCCKTCNIAKHNMSQHDFFKWIDNVYHRCCSPT